MQKCGENLVSDVGVRTSVERFGCDGVIGSTATEDACGVCSGDNACFDLPFATTSDQSTKHAFSSTPSPTIRTTSTSSPSSSTVHFMFNSDEADRSSAIIKQTPSESILSSQTQASPTVAHTSSDPCKQLSFLELVNCTERSTAVSTVLHEYFPTSMDSSSEMSTSKTMPLLQEKKRTTYFPFTSSLNAFTLHITNTPVSITETTNFPKVTTHSTSTLPDISIFSSMSAEPHIETTTSLMNHATQITSSKPKETVSSTNSVSKQSLNSSPGRVVTSALPTRQVATSDGDFTTDEMKLKSSKTFEQEMERSSTSHQLQVSTRSTEGAIITHTSNHVWPEPSPETFDKTESAITASVVSKFSASATTTSIAFTPNRSSSKDDWITFTGKLETKTTSTPSTQFEDIDVTYSTSEPEKQTNSNQLKPTDSRTTFTPASHTALFNTTEAGFVSTEHLSSATHQQNITAVPNTSHKTANVFTLSEQTASSNKTISHTPNVYSGSSENQLHTTIFEDLLSSKTSSTPVTKFGGSATETTSQSFLLTKTFVKSSSAVTPKFQDFTTSKSLLSTTQSEFPLTSASKKSSGETIQTTQLPSTTSGFSTIPFGRSKMASGFSTIPFGTASITPDTGPSVGVSKSTKLPLSIGSTSHTPVETTSIEQTEYNQQATKTADTTVEPAATTEVLGSSKKTKFTENVKSTPAAATTQKKHAFTSETQSIITGPPIIRATSETTMTEKHDEYDFMTSTPLNMKLTVGDSTETPATKSFLVTHKQSKVSVETSSTTIPSLDSTSDSTKKLENPRETFKSSHSSPELKTSQTISSYNEESTIISSTMKQGISF